MKDEISEFHAKKMEMWKRKEEMLNSMSEKELRAYIKGYMMGQRSVFKHLDMISGNGCGCGCNGGQSCGCGGSSCNCGKE
jgi:hypothetical protein